MIQMVIDSQKDFSNNDIYFMETVSDKIIINENYDGVLILDNNLNVLKRIKLFDGRVIDTIFKKDKKVVLYCYENQCFVYIDIELFHYKIIPLSNDLEDMVFLSLYEWRDNNLILLADDGAISVCVNLDDNAVRIMSKDNISASGFSVYDDWETLKSYTIHKVYPERKEAVVESNRVIKFINYKENTQTILDAEPFEVSPLYFYDIEVCEKCIAQISEKKIVLYSQFSDHKNLVLPQSQYNFIRGKFYIIDGVINFFILSSDNSDPNKFGIEKYMLTVV